MKVIMDKDLFKKLGNFDFGQQFELPNIELPSTDYLNIELQPNPTYDLIEKQKEANDLLRQVVDNTSVLKDLVDINRKTQLNTEELTYVMKAIYEVARADSKDEADNLFKKALDVINASGEVASNITHLTSLLLGIYNTVKGII